MAQNKFIYVSASTNVGDGKTYATEAAKWAATIEPYLTSTYAKSIVFREATRELYVHGSLVGNSQVFVTSTTSTKTYDEIASLVLLGAATCHFSDITVDTEMSASGSAPISTVTINDVTTYRASLLVTKTQADQYVINATWAEGDTVPTITITRIESGLVIDEDVETTEND